MLFVLVLLFHIANFHFKDVLTKSGIKNDNQCVHCNKTFTTYKGIILHLVLTHHALKNLMPEEALIEPSASSAKAKSPKKVLIKASTSSGESHDQPSKSASASVDQFYCHICGGKVTLSYES
jgi:hypothetical protein